MVPAHLADHGDRWRNRRFREIGPFAPQAAQRMALLDGGDDLAIGHGVAQRVELRFFAQRAAQRLQSGAEIGHILGGTDRYLVVGRKTLAALRPQEIRIERPHGQPAFPHAGDRAVGQRGGARHAGGKGIRRSRRSRHAAAHARRGCADADVRRCVPLGETRRSRPEWRQRSAQHFARIEFLGHQMTDTSPCASPAAMARAWVSRPVYSAAARMDIEHSPLPAPHASRGQNAHITGERDVIGPCLAGRIFHRGIMVLARHAFVRKGEGRDSFRLGQSKRFRIRIVAGHQRDFVRRAIQAAGIEQRRHIASATRDENRDARPLQGGFRHYARLPNRRARTRRPPRRARCSRARLQRSRPPPAPYRPPLQSACGPSRPARARRRAPCRRRN